MYLLSFGATLLDLLLAIGATAIVCLQTQLLAGWLAPASGVLALASVAGASTIGYTTSAIQIVGHYYHTSHDHAFLAEHGAEMMLEIARFGASIAHFNPERQRYEIHGVMGPDEFHEKYPDATGGGLRNNAYTKHHGGLAVRHRRKPAGYAAREPSRAEPSRAEPSRGAARLGIDDE